MDGAVDLESTTLRGAHERITLRESDGYRLQLSVHACLAPGERLPPSVAYQLCTTKTDPPWPRGGAASPDGSEVREKSCFSR